MYTYTTETYAKLAGTCRRLADALPNVFERTVRLPTLPRLDALLPSTLPRLADHSKHRRQIRCHPCAPNVLPRWVKVASPPSTPAGKSSCALAKPCMVRQKALVDSVDSHTWLDILAYRSAPVGNQYKCTRLSLSSRRHRIPSNMIPRACVCREGGRGDL